MFKNNIRLRLSEIERSLLKIIPELSPEFQISDSNEDKLLLYTSTDNNGYAEFLISYDVMNSNIPITIDSIKLELMYSNANVSSGYASRRRYKLTIITVGEEVLENV